MEESAEKSGKRDIWIKKTSSLSGMHLRRPQDSPAELDLPEDIELILWMRNFENKPEIQPQLCCSSTKKYLVKQSVYSMFESLQKGYLPEASLKKIDLPYRLGSDAIIDVDRKIPEKWGFPLQIMPGAIEGIHNKASKELHEITQSFIKSIRWRQGASGRHSPIAQVSFEWSLNKTDWYHMPSAYSISMSTPKGIDIGKQALESVRSLMLENIGEPTYHELLREAISIAGSNPRSSLLIAFSALEMALKSLVGYLVPNSSTLMEKMPSPSVLTLTQEVVPDVLSSLNLGSDFFPLDDERKNILQKRMAQRNKVAHGMKTKLESESLYEFVKLVRLVLYQCDAHQGHEWASAIGSQSDDIPSQISD